MKDVQRDTDGDLRCPKSAVMLLMLPLLAACGSGGSPRAATPSATSPPAVTSSPAPTLDAYAQSACTKIDEGRSKITAYSSDANPFSSSSTQATGDYLAAIHAYEAAVLEAKKSPDPDVSAMATKSLVPISQIATGNVLQDDLSSWRSLCESKGWVGTP